MKRAVVTLACLLMVCLGVGAQVPNDTCGGSLWVYDGVNPNAPAGASGTFFSNAGAAVAPEQVTPGCSPGPDYKDVWFRYIATTSGFATFETCTPAGLVPGSTATTLAVYSNCFGAFVACGGSLTACPTLSKVFAQVAAGGSYLIRVASPQTTPNGGTFYLKVTPPPPPPPNDNQANATPIFAGLNPAAPGQSFTTWSATPDGTGLCTTLSDVDVWFTYTATSSGALTVSAAAAPGSAAVALLDIHGPGGAVYYCAQSQPLPFPVTSGAQYLIRARSSYGPGADFTLTVTGPGPVAPNDECVNATPLVLGTNGPFSPVNATPSPYSQPFFGGADVWYQFSTGPCPTTCTFDTCSAVGAPVPSAIFASCGGAYLAASDYNYYYQPLLCVNQHRVTVLAPANASLKIRGPGYGTYTIVVSQGAVMNLAFSSPVPGSIKANIDGGPPAGLYYLAVTLNQGLFPYGPAWGVQMSHGELLAQVLLGPPFSGNLDACGNLQIGPVFGAPPGLTLYSVALAFANGWSQTPTIYTFPASYTIP